MPHHNAAFNLAYWILRNREEAEDVVQEAYVRRQVLCDSLRFSRREALARLRFQVRRLYAGAAIVCV